ncbi:MAG: formate--tetrahydrofolate ligase, partial [Methylomarinum sp.]|nr:formate--tetrahydrofolate ligase [Methylomarinum sp.]
ALGAKCVVSKHWAEGGAGAEELAQEVLNIVYNREPEFTYVYDEDLPLWEKIETIATKLYGAAGITASPKVRGEIKALQEKYGKFPICMAKTQMSFSTDPTAKGAPSGHTVEISEIKLANGAGFIVAIAGNMMTMPGLPKVPAAERIDITDDGIITGLF